VTLRSFHRTTLKFLTCFIGVTLSAAALGQAPRSSIDTPASKGLPEFRDPKTGQVWTPANVGGVSGPNTPADRAFDPLAQMAVVQGVVVQRPQITQVGTVPITAGPTMPIVTIENASLNAIPGKRWQVVLYMNNNSANTAIPVINCRFTNGGRLVQETNALVPPTGAGMRVGMTIYGPKVELFVDRAACGVTSP
jgi:hypothetical protein